MRLCLLSAMLLWGLGGLFAPVPVYAYDSAPSYIEPPSLPPELLPPPPAEGSKAWRAQIAGVLQAQKHLSAADIAAMRDEQHLRLELMTSVLGANFTRENLPKTFAMLDRVLASAGQVTEADKKFWHTRRPYLTDKRVTLYIDPIDSSPAYPSGHTSEARVLAEILGMLRPAHLADLRARADAIAARRIEAGVHYPGDVEGGRALAMLVVGALLENDDFQDDLAAARKEIGGK
jgi:acid phosphatase (class A)